MNYRWRIITRIFAYPPDQPRLKHVADYPHPDRPCEPRAFTISTTLNTASQRTDADPYECHHNPGILTNRQMSLRAHPRIGPNLRHRILGDRRLLSAIRPRQRMNIEIGRAHA